MADDKHRRVKGTAMSEELDNQTETVEAETVVAEPQGEVQDSTDWKAEARKWEKRAKESAGDRELALKWREYEESLKPAQEKLADDLNNARAEAESARAALLRYEIANEKNIPSDAIKLLNGSTREELEEAADVLVALIANQSKPKTPAPDMNQGLPSSDKIGQLTAADLESMSPAEINEARKAGRLNDVLGIN
jgi:hypothetical protein